MRLLLSLFKMYLFILVMFTPAIIMMKINTGNDKFNVIVGIIISIVLVYKLSKFILLIGRDTEESIF